MSIAVPPLPSLVVVLRTIPDFRAARGQRHGLVPLLLLICIALLCGAQGESAIAGWGRSYGQPWLRRLGFTRATSPSQATIHRVLAGVSVTAVEAALGQWAEAVHQVLALPALPGIAVDGKVLRGSKRRGVAQPHLVATLSHHLGVVFGQVAVAAKTNEITAANELLLTLVLVGRVVTTDALLTQRTIARTILAQGGDYLLPIKANHPTLFWELTTHFDAATPGPTLRVTTQHGDRVETRTLRASTALVGYSQWPGLVQTLCLHRRVVHKTTGVVLRDELAYAVTPLPPARATLAQLLALWRGHWAIENRLHWVRDVTFAEDHAQIWYGTIPQCFAAFRNLVIGLLRVGPCRNLAMPSIRLPPALPWALPQPQQDFE